MLVAFCRSFFYCVKFSSVEKERELCRARSPSFRFSKIIVGNLLMKRDSHTKGPSKSSPPLFDGGFFERAASKNKGGTLERPPPPPRPRPVESCARCSKARTHFLSVVWVSFFTQLNKPLKETIETIEFGTLFATSAQKQRSPLSPHQPRRRPKGGRKR